MKVNAKVVGVEDLKKQLRQYAQKVENATKESIKESSREIANDARAACRSQSIASEIKVNQTKEGATITTNSETSAYLEFGTGNFAKATLATYPDDWRELALKFFISGLGRMPSFPYLHPAFQRGKQDAILDAAIKIESI